MPGLSDLPLLLEDLREHGLLRDAWALDASEELVDFTLNDTLGFVSAERGASVSRETSNGCAGERPDPETQPVAGAGASRLLGGTLAVHREVEAFLSEWLEAESALLFPSGYSANVGTLAALLGPNDLVLSDALNHASLIDGIRLGRARNVIFPHLDLAKAERMWRAAVSDGPPSSTRERPATWLVLESYYSMDGDSPDLGRARALCDEHGWNLYVDEAHAFGLFGPGGRGLSAAAGARPDVLMVGFGKAIGAAGGAIVGSRALREWLWNKARSFVFTTAPSPVGTSALLGALGRAARADAERARSAELSAEFRTALEREGVRLGEGTHGPIVSVVLGDERVAVEAGERLKAKGFRVLPVRPPTVPKGTSRLRVTVTAAHEPGAILRLAAEIGAIFREHPSLMDL